MTISEIVQYFSNTGLAVFIVAWGIWRLDKFLIKICHHIEIINGEMGALSQSIEDVVEHIKKKSDNSK